MDSFSPVVITSRAADEHFDTIRQQHDEILKGLSDQSVRVANYNAEKAMRDNQMKIDEALTQKAKMDAENKRRELDIKQAALFS